MARPIFISYRREDSEGQAGRLFEALRAEFGADAVFMDVATIEPGVDFRQVIDAHTAGCGALLAVIGKRWLTASDAQGSRRLDDPHDFVRLETASALKRGIPVIPVLVQDAPMVRPGDLPDDLKDLAFRNNVALTHARWDSDVQDLITKLRPLLLGRSGWSRWAATGKQRTAVVAAAIAAAVMGLGLWGYWEFNNQLLQERERTIVALQEAQRNEEKKRAAEQEATAAAKLLKEAAEQADKVLKAQQAEIERLKREAQTAETESQRQEAKQLAIQRAADANRKRQEAELLTKQAADADRKRLDAQAARQQANITTARIYEQASNLGIEAFATARPTDAFACQPGFVWREAWEGDRVCVTPETQKRTASDNAKAPHTREPTGGAHGPNTCKAGYVWREARRGDVVCVAPAVREQAQADNAAAASRRATAP
jgi:flagellar biosynthesis GTPase FlhF